MNIYIVRHGESEHNKAGIWQGLLDGELSEVGIEQARKLSNKLQNEKIDAIYSSKLKRAMKTADIIAEKHNLKVERYKEFNECKIELWNGYSINDVFTKFSSEFEEWANNPWTIIEGVESMGNLQKRVVEKFLKIVKKHSEEDTILIVSHGLALRTIIHWIFEMPLNKYRKIHLYNTSLTKIKYEKDTFSIEFLNDTSHLTK
ncbi:phosphoglycerate mutase [Tepiditoga spiralis]|uniref:Phosphoglycerate mutase n=1 Tax=Tepiditoga spiralis TaxID=2108365 RepID=A0A7G1GB17_9BACT|nr:histidine phosphatase family protein [Tepiditoga spiralis]BBE31492.1 phosphoglycerate mutase [Tepiditoga spiralis]